MKTQPFLLLLVFVLIISCNYFKEISFNSFGIDPISNEIKEGEYLQNIMEYYNVPGVSIAVVNNRKLAWTRGYGFANTKNNTKVTSQTLFQAASISKPITALAALKLVDEGKIDLDKDLNLYLKDWKIPENKFTKNKKVTLRKLLTHTAGITIHGFTGYPQHEKLPSTIDILNGKGNSGKIYVNKVPGSEWSYSGGGYTIIEKLIKDVSGIPLEEYALLNIFSPLKMFNSTFSQPLPSNLISSASAAYNEKGEMIEALYYNYPERAAAGLWTTPTDLAKYCMAIQEIMTGKPNGILSNKIVKSMLTKHNNNWGLGPTIKGEDKQLWFEHGGKNIGFTNMFYSSVYSGKALIIMTNGDNGGKLINKIKNSITAHYKMKFD